MQIDLYKDRFKKTEQDVFEDLCHAFVKNGKVRPIFLAAHEAECGHGALTIFFPETHFENTEEARQEIEGIMSDYLHQHEPGEIGVGLVKEVIMGDITVAVYEPLHQIFAKYTETEEFVEMTGRTPQEAAEQIALHMGEEEEGSIEPDSSMPFLFNFRGQTGQA